MALYVCLNCRKEIPSDTIRSKIRCRYCGSKLLGKKRVNVTKLLAR